MTTKPAIVRKSDIERSVKAVMAAGLSVVRVEIDRQGKVVIVTAEDKPETGSALDQWREKKHGTRKV